MHINRRLARRVGAAITAACTAILLPAAALAAPAHPGSASAPTALPQCTAGDLTTWAGIPGDGSAGHTNFQLELSNTAGPTCTLFGFPGVSAVGRNGHQLGNAAIRNASHRAQLVVLPRGATAHVELAITDITVFSRSSCRPVTAAGLRVIAPGSFVSQTVPLTFRACAKHGPDYLSVTTTISGTGIPNFSF
jgi:Protein of unknown function (DUF4232)